MNQIRSLPYVVSDSDALNDLQDDLTNLLEALQKKAPEENCLIVETVQPKRKLGHEVLPELPKPKRLKTNITNCVGAKACAQKMTTKVNQNILSDFPPGLSEEIAPVDGARYGVPMLSDEINIVDMKVDKSDADIGDIMITQIVKRNNEKIKQRRVIKFSSEEKELIMGNEMLSDESINISMNLLHANNFQIFQDLLIHHLVSVNSSTLYHRNHRIFKYFMLEIYTLVMCS